MAPMLCVLRQVEVLSPNIQRRCPRNHSALWDDMDRWLGLGNDRKADSEAEEGTVNVVDAVIGVGSVCWL